MNDAISSTPELRRDAFSTDWVIVAAGRRGRPHSEGAKRPTGVRLEYDPGCPFCPGNEGSTPPAVVTVSDPAAREPWLIRVVPNLFPVVSDPQRGAGAVGNRFFQSKRAAGVHEVVIETPIHNQELTTRHPALVNLMLKTWRRRLIALMSRPEIQHVVVFKNKGRDAGNSLDHPHSQIVGLNFVPAEVRRRVQTARRFHRRSGNCLVCEAVNEERRAGARVVYEADRLLAFEPFAAGWVGETLLVPLNHSASYTAAADDQLEALGEGIVRVLQGTAESYDDPPFNLVLHTAPKPYASDRALHWYVQLIPRLGQWGGFELGTGVRINPIAPKGVAQDLWTTRMPVPRGSRRRRVR